MFFLLQISSAAKYFFLSFPRHWDRGLIVVILYYFQIYEKEHNIICRVINNHMSPMYTETPYMYVYINVCVCACV